MVDLRVPRYEDLPRIEEGGDAHAWDVFGPGDSLGTLNFLDPSRVAAALRSVVEGHVISLSLPMDSDVAGLSPERDGYEQRELRTRMGRDDVLDNLYLQGTSQWDGLRHIRYRQHGYYGGREEEDLDRGELGVDVIAARGIVGRAVLLDAAEALQPEPDRRRPIGPHDLDELCERQGVEVRLGDVLLLRTGWLGWFRALSPESRRNVLGTLHGGEGGLECPGLDPDADTAAWLWDHGVAAVAADNPAVETLRIDPQVGFLHRRLIPLLGMPLGELWDLDEVASECARRGSWEFTVISTPCRVPGAAGSPANALAVW